jgi:hypothetical protein
MSVRREINFDTFWNHSSLLTDLALLHGSDKGGYGSQSSFFTWPHHTYTDLYTRIFSLGRNSVQKIFECGLGTNNPSINSNMTTNGKPGASLRMWRDYFPNAQVYGADIDSEILFEEERISTFYVDQTSPTSIQIMWEKIGSGDLDIIIDDGLHTYEAGITLFENSIEFLRHGGIYIIEDVAEASVLRFQKYFNEKNILVDFIRLNEPSRFMYDNNLVVIWKP